MKILHTFTRKTTRKAAIALALFVSFFNSAYAQVPFAAGATTLTADILAMVTPLAGIAVIAVGAICWVGRISWAWFAALIVGIVLVFGNAQIVSWIRSLFGV